MQKQKTKIDEKEDYNALAKSSEVLKFDEENLQKPLLSPEDLGIEVWVPKESITRNEAFGLHYVLGIDPYDTKSSDLRRGFSEVIKGGLRPFQRKGRAGRTWWGDEF